MGTGVQRYFVYQNQVYTSNELSQILGVRPKTIRRRADRGEIAEVYMIKSHSHKYTWRHHPLYKTYRSMKARCLNPNRPGYSNYGGRGIKVCDRWLDSFENFAEDIESSIGLRKSDMSLDRKDNDGNYEPGNMRWATREQQNNNQRTRKDALWITDGQKSQCLAAWARELRVSYLSLRKQVQMGRHPFLTLLGQYGELYPDG